MLKLNLLWDYFWIRSVGLSGRLVILIGKLLLFFLIWGEFIWFNCCWLYFFFDLGSFSYNWWFLNIALWFLFLRYRHWSLKLLLYFVCSNLRTSSWSSDSRNFRFSSCNRLWLTLNRFLRCFTQLTFNSERAWLLLLYRSLNINLRWGENWFCIIICFNVESAQRNSFFRSRRVFIGRSWDHSLKWAFFFLKLSDSLLAFSIFFNSLYDFILWFLRGPKWVIHHHLTFTLRLLLFLCWDYEISRCLLSLLYTNSASYVRRRLEWIILDWLRSWLVLLSNCWDWVFCSKRFWIWDLRKLSHQVFILCHVNPLRSKNIRLLGNFFIRSFDSRISLLRFLFLHGYFSYIKLMLFCSSCFIIEHPLDSLLLSSLNLISKHLFLSLPSFSLSSQLSISPFPLSLKSIFLTLSD